MRHRNYRLYFVGQMVSLVGSWAQSTAVAWLAYRLTGQSKWPAFLMAAQIAPTLLLGAWAGGLADRVAKRRLIVVTQIIFLGIATTLTTLAYLDLVTVWVLLAVNLCQGAVQAIDLPRSMAFSPELVPRADLINAVALNSLLFNVALAVGPAVAGVLVAGVGERACSWSTRSATWPCWRRCGGCATCRRGPSHGRPGTRSGGSRRCGGRRGWCGWWW